MLKLRLKRATYSGYAAHISRTAVSALFVVLALACSENNITGPLNSDPAVTPELTLDDQDFTASDWTTDTHSKGADPNFEEVFEDNAVKRIDIVITEERWALMLHDMTTKHGTFGTGGGRPPFDADNPIWVPAEVFYGGREWYRVGVRFKGNSSLSSSWGRGIMKLSLKLDFDEFEDDYPQIDNQRFYGFKKLSLKNNFEDRSMLREKVAGDVFRNAGLAGSHTAFYTLYIDHGDGPVYFGVYTMVEEVDGTVLDTQFSDDDGNLYKPEGTGASFRKGTFDENDFVKKTNEDDLDWSDILSLFEALHADTRTTDAVAWRSSLEGVLDVNTFLKYLAVNTVIQNWDTYGRMTQNYYLYNNSDTDQLVWIPWDNNESLQEGKMGGSLALNFLDLTPNAWPLIEYLYEDTVYKDQYDVYVDDVINGAFETNSIRDTYASYAALIEPYATAEIAGYTFLNSSGDFQSAISELNAHASARAAAARSYLAN